MIVILNGEGWAIGLASIAFFGLCAVAIGYMIRAKRDTKAPRGQDGGSHDHSAS